MNNFWDATFFNLYIIFVVKSSLDICWRQHCLSSIVTPKYLIHLTSSTNATVVFMVGFLISIYAFNVDMTVSNHKVNIICDALTQWCSAYLFVCLFILCCFILWILATSYQIFERNLRVLILLYNWHNKNQYVFLVLFSIIFCIPQFVLCAVPYIVHITVSDFSFFDLTEHASFYIHVAHFFLICFDAHMFLYIIFYACLFLYFSMSICF